MILMTAESRAGSSKAWYTGGGDENDVVLSTRVRLARNLANFPFPDNCSDDDAERIQSLVFDSFNHVSDPDAYQAIPMKKVPEESLTILREWGILDMPDGTGLVMKNSGELACTVNSVDHVRVAAFVPGLEIEHAFSVCSAVDGQLQQTLQFAASYDFGFLTSSLYDAGSGMKTSLWVHLPSLAFTGALQDVLDTVRQRDFTVKASYGFSDDALVALGKYYQISSASSFNGNEIDQIASAAAAGKYLAEQERKARAEVLKIRPTPAYDIVYRAYAMVKYSRLISLREGVDIISALKWGRDLNMLTGIEDTDFCALLYRIQPGHLRFLLSNGAFSFEQDVKDDPALKIDRLRSLILQEALENTAFSRQGN